MRKKLYISNLFILKQISLYSKRRLGLLIALLITFVSSGFSQSDTVNIQTSNKLILKINDSDDEKEDTIDNKKMGNCEEALDTTILKIGKKLFIFIEYEESMVVDRFDTRTGETKRVLDFGCDDSESTKDTIKFRGHWSGIEVGINELASSSFSMKRPTGYDYLDLNTFRSWNLNINFAQSSLPLIKKRVGLVSGFGLEMNSYSFQDGNSIQVNELTGIIEERELESNYNVQKSKFSTIYVTMPVILEAQFGKGNNRERLYFSGGIIGGYKISSNVKIVHKVDGKKQKLIERRGDLNINRFRMGLTARAGYKDYFNLYATYYLTPLFEDDNPELHPFAIGLRVNF